MPVKQAFQSQIAVIEIPAITLLKAMPPAYRKTHTYRRIAASIGEVGVIEPLVVFLAGDGKYMLLDGHTRLDIMAAAGWVTADCLLATENESYNYNKRVNHIPPIAQHHMILRALAHSSESRIAAALNVAVSTIKEKRDLLKGICPEAVEILLNERVSADAFTALRKMKALRQIDVARLMLSARKFTGRFARALLNGTRDEFLVSVPSTKSRKIPLAEKSMMEHETEELLRHAESIKANYGDDVLKLTAACKYVERLLGNILVRRHLARHHEDTLAALEQLIADGVADKKQRNAASVRTSSAPTGPQARARA